MAPRKTCANVEAGSRCKVWVGAETDYCSKHQPKREKVVENEEPVEARPKTADQVSAENAALAAAFLAQGLEEPLDQEAQAQGRLKRDSEAPVEEEERERGTVVAPVGPQHLEGQALRASLELLAEDRARMKLQQEARAKARRLGKKPPVFESKLFLADAPDEIAITDKNGKSLVRPGWIGRWVRLTDSQGRESNRRLRHFIAWGAEVIRDPDKPKVNGEHPPKTDVWGIAVQIPADRYGARVIANSPRAAFDSDVILSNLDDLAESINSESGYPAIRLSPGAEHGSRSL